MSQTANGCPVIVNTLATGIAGIGFDVMPPIVETMTIEAHAVDCSSVRHSGERLASPRRIRGHNGSPGYSPDVPVEALLLAGVSQADVDAVLSRSSTERILELTASLLLSADHRLSSVLQSEWSIRCNPVGFSSRPSHGAITVEPVTLDSIVASLTDAVSERRELGQLVATMLDSARAGLGAAMLDGATQKDAAISLGCSQDTVGRAVNRVRDLLTARA